MDSKPPASIRNQSLDVTGNRRPAPCESALGCWWVFYSKSDNKTNTFPCYFGKGVKNVSGSGLGIFNWNKWEGGKEEKGNGRRRSVTGAAWKWRGEKKKRNRERNGCSQTFLFLLALHFHGFVKQKRNAPPPHHLSAWFSKILWDSRTISLVLQCGWNLILRDSSEMFENRPDSRRTLRWASSRRLGSLQDSLIESWLMD